MKNKWQFFSPQNTSFLKNNLNQVTQIVKNLNFSKPFFVLSERALETKHVKELFNNFEKEKIEYTVSTSVAPEAPSNLVQKLKIEFNKNKCDSIIAIGGGSVIDLAKATSIVAKFDGNIEEYFGLNTVPDATIPKILIPTTSGTGSESSNIIVLSNKEEKSKRGIVSNFLFAEWIVLDPTLTYSMPKDLTLACGLDAFAQCLESLTSKNASPISRTYSANGLKLILNNLQKAIDEKPTARDNMSLAAYYSGIAISGGNAGTNLAHAIGNTLGGMYHIPHGFAVSAVIEQVLHFNSRSKQVKTLLDNISKTTEIEFTSFLEKIKDRYSIPTLKQLNINTKDKNKIVEKVMSDQKRLLDNNPVEVSYKSVEKIIQNSF